MPQLIIAERASSRERGTDGLQRSLDPSVFSTLGSGGDLSGDGRISRYLHTMRWMQRSRSESFMLHAALSRGGADG